MVNTVINDRDNVEVCLENGHKYARCDIKKGSAVIKYGYPIGVASANIKKGEHVHSHNLKTALSGKEEYSYNPSLESVIKREPFSINAFVRNDGNIGIRNDIWIINTVGCVNNTARLLSEKTGALYFPHPYGCSQLGGDLENTQKILCSLIKHPNAGGVLVLGLGCENNNIAELKKRLGTYDEKRVRFLNVQDCTDELQEGIRLIEELKRQTETDVRQSVPVSKLKIGLKCGGSDGLSGITANPLVGKVCDTLVACGASCVLTEVPEMFGAEQLLMNRCENEEVFNKTVELINSFKDYYISHSQPVSENPSPGNKAGGITTLEEKSLGCVQKGGRAPVRDVIGYGESVKSDGLTLLSAPGNDIVASTALAAAGCQLILFTTGRGTPLGAPVPVIKLSSNTALYNRKPQWIDLDAQSADENALLELIRDTANGKLTKNEEANYHDFAIFKNGVTL